MYIIYNIYYLQADRKMYGTDILIQKVLLLTAMVAFGVILRKCGKADASLAKGFADTVIYISQPAMIIYGFLEADFSSEIILTSVCVFVFSMAFHMMFYGVSLLLYKNAHEKHRTVLRFATVFTNAGFMGIPLISELISPVAAIYATFYVVSFNIFNWTLGCYIYTGDRKYFSVKKMLFNPATIPTYIGLVLFIAGGLITLPEQVIPAFRDFIIPVVKDNILFLLKSTVIPMSMMMIGIRLAESNLRTIFRDRYLPLLMAVRLMLLPLAIMLIMKLVILTGLIPDNIIIPAATVLVISASTPAAAMASIFAEKFDGDAIYASKIVSATTLMSMITMPAVSMLLLKFF